MEIEHILKGLEGQIGDRLLKLKSEWQGIRTNRPAPDLVENIMVSYIDQKISLKQLGSIGIKPPREITIQVWDEQVIPAIIKAIEEARLGLSVQRDSHVIRAFLPPLTDERRNELAKTIKKMAEEVRIFFRSLRDENNKKIKNAESEKSISQDQSFKAKDKIQQMIDKGNSQVDELLNKKIEELSN